MPQDIRMGKALEGQDHLYTLITQTASSDKVRVVGSIRDYVHIVSEFDRFIQIITSEQLKILSLTVTEKGYCNTSSWDLDVENKGIQHDLTHGDEIPQTIIGVLARGLEERMHKDAPPITIMSCDNIPGNGEVLKRILTQFIDLKKDVQLKTYLDRAIRFPSCMVDRITPVTTDDKKRYLEQSYGITDQVPVFSEDFIQWVIEDDFNVDRPEWERLGVQMVEDVKPYEIMKTRLLNGGHSALAFPSLLAGFEFVNDAMSDPQIIAFVRAYMLEVKETLDPIDGVDYDAYIEQLLQRFANPATRDRIQRLAEDSSAKFLNFIIQPMMILLEQGRQIPLITFTLASWIVYLHSSTTRTDYVVNDPIEQRLKHEASASLEDVKAFLSIKEVFPTSIMNYISFHDKLLTCVRTILEVGIREAISFLLCE